LLPLAVGVEGDMEERDGEETGLSNVGEVLGCSKRRPIEGLNFGIAGVLLGSIAPIGAFDNVFSFALVPGWLELLSGAIIANTKTIRVSATRILVCRLPTLIFLESIRVPQDCYCQNRRKNYTINYSIKPFTCQNYLETPSGLTI
jgi:hypothetical protein